MFVIIHGGIHMKNRIYNILLITALTFSLSACGNKNNDKFVIAEPESIEQGTVEQIKWDELGNLEDVPELRESWNETLGVTGTTGNYNGLPFYTPDGKADNNNTLDVGLHNRELAPTYVNELNSDMAMTNDSIQLIEGTKKSYTDLDEEDDGTVIAMGINGYYDIVPDNEPGYSNPYQTLTREQAMSGAMRATTPVDPTLTVNPDYEKAVGKSEYNLYAQSLDETSYLSTSDGSLNENTAHSTITRGEVVYMLVNTYYQDEMQNVKISDDGKSATFTYTDNYGIEQTETIELIDATNGGDITASHNFTSKSQTLRYMLENPDDGVDEQMYKALIIAKHYNIIDTETSWDEGITKSDYIKMLVQALSHQTTTMDYFKYKTSSLVTNSNESTTGLVIIEDPDRPGVINIEFPESVQQDPGPDADYSETTEVYDLMNKAVVEYWDNYGETHTREEYYAAHDAYKEAGAGSILGIYWHFAANTGGDTTGKSYLLNPYTGEKYYPGDWVPGLGSPYWGTLDEAREWM